MRRAAALTKAIVFFASVKHSSNQESLFHGMV